MDKQSPLAYNSAGRCGGGHGDGRSTPLRGPGKAQTLADLTRIEGHRKRMKNPWVRRLLPIHLLPERVAEDGKRSWGGVQHGAQGLLPGEIQMRRAEEDYFQIVIGAQLGQAAKAGGRFQGPIKLGDQAA